MRSSLYSGSLKRRRLSGRHEWLFTIEEPDAKVPMEKYPLLPHLPLGWWRHPRPDLRKITRGFPHRGFLCIFLLHTTMYIDISCTSTEGLNAQAFDGTHCSTELTFSSLCCLVFSQCTDEAFHTREFAGSAFTRPAALCVLLPHVPCICTTCKIHM